MRNSLRPVVSGLSRNRCSPGPGSSVSSSRDLSIDELVDAFFQRSDRKISVCRVIDRLSRWREDPTITPDLHRSAAALSPLTPAAISTVNRHVI
ncbi:hypothetical protein PUN28_010146 [Cardiocondyla obscurior]|uniref:Uncharacterized protein n=1 Tax=Cardiocondyla obscurior TaxID=286306 RepID=A0AAW2FSG1_9HYME